MATALLGLLALCSLGRNLSLSPEDLEANVLYVDAKNSFIVIDKGKKDGLGESFDYEVVRATPAGTVSVGRGSFEKFIGQDTMSKLKVDDAAIDKMKVGDRVICRRKV